MARPSNRDTVSLTDYQKERYQDVDIYSRRSLPLAGVGIGGLIVGAAATVILPMLYMSSTSSMFGLFDPLVFEIFVPTVVTSSVMTIIGAGMIAYGLQKDYLYRTRLENRELVFDPNYKYNKAAPKVSESDIEYSVTINENNLEECQMVKWMIGGEEGKPSQIATIATSDNKTPIIRFSSNCLSSITSKRLTKPQVQASEALEKGGKWILKYDKAPDDEWERIKELLQEGLLYGGEVLAPGDGFNHYTITFDIYDAMDEEVKLRTYDTIKCAGLDTKARQDSRGMAFKTHEMTRELGSNAEETFYKEDDIKKLREEVIKEYEPRTSNDQSVGRSK